MNSSFREYLHYLGTYLFTQRGAGRAWKFTLNVFEKSNKGDINTLKTAFLLNCKAKFHSFKTVKIELSVPVSFPKKRKKKEKKT